MKTDTVTIKGETFAVRSNKAWRDSCQGCYFSRPTRFNKAGLGTCVGNNRVLSVCADNNMGSDFKNMIMIKL